MSQSDWKNNTDQTYRPASLGIMAPNCAHPLKPRVHHSIIVLRGLRAAPNWAPILHGDANLSDSRCKFFQFGVARIKPAIQVSFFIIFY